MFGTICRGWVHMLSLIATSGLLEQRVVSPVSVWTKEYVRGVALATVAVTLPLGYRAHSD